MLAIQLLGNFTVHYNDQPLETLNDSPRLQMLLAYLVLHHDAPQPRQQIAFLFWPDSSEQQARTNLRKLLLQLRRALPAAKEFLADTQQTIQWKPDAPFSLDVAEVQRLLEQFQNEPPDLALLTSLSDLYSGELLPNCYDDWVLALRQHLHESVTQALSQLVTVLEQGHAYTEGIRYAQQLLALDPLQEQSYLHLIRLRALAGDRTGALRTYHDCVATLRREFDMEPAADLQTLAKQLQAGIPIQTAPAAERVTEPTPAPPAEIRGHPMQTTPCIGRAQDLQKLAERLATPYCRLLTLYGPGGMGKTRLALALAEAERNVFRHGVCFVPLASLSAPENIAPAIAHVLGLHLVEGRRPETQLLAHMRDQQLLLILDNAEHLLTEAADPVEGASVQADPVQASGALPATEADFASRSGLKTHALIEQLLAAAPGVKIVVTSRQLLDLYEEHTYEVKGLSLTPSAIQAEPSTMADPLPKTARGIQSAEEDALSAAETLFYHQMARVRPDLSWAEFSAADRSAVTHLCQLVEGMPLALELAATQTRTLALGDLVTSIQQNLDLLKVRWRGAHQRHQSMRAVIDASVMTLSKADQLYLARLAIFQGGFSSLGAQAVARASIDVLETLLHKSLLRRAVGDHSTAQRFDLHTLIRQYAAESLATFQEEAQQTAARYYGYHATLLREGMARWQAASYAPAEIAPLAQEIDNLSAAGRWLLHHGTAQQRQVYLQDLWDLHRVERRLPEMIELLSEAISVTQRADPVADAVLLAQWCRMLGEAYHILGEFKASRRHFEETLRLLHFPLAGGGVELLTTLQRQGLQQVLNRLGAMNLFQRSSATEGADPSLLDAIEAYRQLVDISLFSGDIMRLVNSALYALNLAERSGDPAARALTYGLMCLMTSAVPGVKLGQIYERLTLEQLPLVQAPERQIDIAIYLSAYYAGQGNWSKLDERMRAAIAQSHALHAYRRWGYSQAIWASMFLYRGQFVNGLQAWHKLYAQSLASDSFLFILPAWAAGGMALCHVRLGAWQRAIELAEEGLVHLQGKEDAIGHARCYAAMALARLLRQEHQLALNAANQARTLMGKQRPTNYAALECYAWVAEVYLGLWQSATQEPTAAVQDRLPPLFDEIDQPLTSKQLQAKARSAWQALQTYAQIFAIGRPSAYLMQGDYAWLDGRPADAIAAWQQCIERATELEMHYELACAHLKLGHHLAPDAAQRTAHLHNAQRILASLQVPLAPGQDLSLPR